MQNNDGKPKHTEQGCTKKTETKENHAIKVTAFQLCGKGEVVLMQKQTSFRFKRAIIKKYQTEQISVRVVSIWCGKVI